MCCVVCVCFTTEIRAQVFIAGSGGRGTRSVTTTAHAVVLLQLAIVTQSFCLSNKLCVHCRYFCSCTDIESVCIFCVSIVYCVCLQ